MENGHQFVGEVLKESFRIPKYQRGYRWTEQNVIKLLEDIYEGHLFNKEEINNCANQNILLNKLNNQLFRYDNDIETPKSPYCIQPLAVMKINDQKDESEYYDVIDGQQRLTTIVIIRAALKKVVKLQNIKPANIAYQSRDTSKQYLDFLYENASKPNDNNIDFEYMQQAFYIAEDYYTKVFMGIDDNKMNIYAMHLETIICQNTQFIWYKVNDSSEKPQKVFANFNTGKIELTNAELIKALFMDPTNYGSLNFKDKQIVISEKWDEIENQLHDPDFWTFVPHKNQYDETSKEYSTRIDIIFDFLIMNNWIKEEEQKGRKLDDIGSYINYRMNKLSDKYIFNEIEIWIKNKLKTANTSEEKEAIIDVCWREVGKIFSGLKELYSADSRIYNMTGLYINLRNKTPNNVDNYNIKDKDLYLRVYNEIYEILKNPRNKREYVLKLLIKRNIIADNNKDVETYIKKIRYKEGEPSEIVKVLLIYNIALLCTSHGTGERFNFRLNAHNKWEREHIFATNVKERKVEVIGKEKEIQRTAALLILMGDSYIDYIKYLYDILDINVLKFNYEKIEYTLNTSQYDIVEKFVASNIAYDGNGQNEMLARALKVKSDAKKLLGFYNNMEEINQILAEKDTKLQLTLAYKYISSFEDKFHYKENVDFILCNDVVTMSQSIKRPRLDPNNPSYYYIDFKSCNYSYTLTQDEIVHIPEWMDWLERAELENDGRSNYNIVLGKISEAFQNKLQNILYFRDNGFNKLKDFTDVFYGNEEDNAFILSVLDISRKTLSIRVDDFFENDLPKLLGDNSMGNMALLTGNKKRENQVMDISSMRLNDKNKSQNQLVSDFPYCMKKNMVYDFYKNGQFVPLGTLFVFTDLYTRGTNTADFWLPDSRIKYLKDMIETIKSFLL